MANFEDFFPEGALSKLNAEDDYSKKFYDALSEAEYDLRLFIKNNPNDFLWDSNADIREDERSQIVDGISKWAGALSISHDRAMIDFPDIHARFFPHFVRLSEMKAKEIANEDE